MNAQAIHRTAPPGAFAASRAAAEKWLRANTRSSAATETIGEAAL